MNFGSFAQKVNLGLDQVKQFAVEKLGTADPECITELPQDYLQLEHKVEKVRGMYETFLRLSANFGHRDYDPTVTDAVKDAVGKFNDLVIRPAAHTLQSAASGTSIHSAQQSRSPVHMDAPLSPGQEQLPKSLAHAFARSASDSALAIGEQEPLGAALRKYAQAQDQLGNARLQFESSVNGKFIQPWTATMNTNIQFALKAKKYVNTCRLQLDAAKSRMKNAKSDKLAQAQVEFTKAEDALLVAVKDATYKIRLVVDSPEPLRNLSDLVNAQLAYFKEGFETLSALSPEMDELQVTQEALFRNGN